VGSSLRGLPGGEHLLPPLLPLLIGDVEDVAHEGGVALGIRQLVRVDVPNGPDDGLRQRVPLQAQRAQEGRRAVVRVQRLHQVGVPVREVREHACTPSSPTQPHTRVASHHMEEELKAPTAATYVHVRG
jgi:hypothetical protein